MNERIKKMLMRFTDNYGNGDIDFIEYMDYPKAIKIIDNSVEVTPENPTLNMTITTVETIDELEGLFKKLPEDCVIKIANLESELTLRSRI